MPLSNVGIRNDSEQVESPPAEEITPSQSNRPKVLALSTSINQENILTILEKQFPYLAPGHVYPLWIHP